jgi:hypothetical protein
MAKPATAKTLLPVMITLLPKMSDSLPATTKATQVESSHPELIHPCMAVAS